MVLSLSVLTCNFSRAVITNKLEKKICDRDDHDRRDAGGLRPGGFSVSLRFIKHLVGLALPMFRFKGVFSKLIYRNIGI